MAAPKPPPDELQYRRPDIIDWWVNVERGQPMDENMMHRYLAESPFFDHTSNNGAIFNQAAGNAQMFQLTKDRKRLEEVLSQRTGDEYMIVGTPQSVELPGVPKGSTSSGVYNIRKQAREREGRDVTLVPLQTLYTCGENMYQAPSVADVLENRLMSVTRHLSELLERMASVPTFTPAKGYAYTTSSPDQTKQSKTQPSSDSKSASLEPSRQPSLAPPAAEDGSSQAPATTSNPATAELTTATSTTAPSSSTQGSALLQTSFNLSLQHADDFTDENPLVGEPGNFTFTSTAAAVRKRKAEEEKREASAVLLKNQQMADDEAKKRGSSGPGMPGKVEGKGEGSAKGLGPPAVMTEAGKGEKAGHKERRVKTKRKKGKANIGSVVGSPVTPGGPPGADAGLGTGGSGSGGGGASGGGN